MNPDRIDQPDYEDEPVTFVEALKAIGMSAVILATVYFTLLIVLTAFVQ